MAKVMVGMSGGVDSSVTAHLLQEAGYEVIGLSFLLWEARLKTSATACCSVAVRDGAEQTARTLGLPLRTMDVRGTFYEKVIDPFIEAYGMGLTPNPCILCNRHIKFPLLTTAADEAGAEFIATGHYARIDRRPEGEPTLLQKGVDRRKDQSYVLYVLEGNHLQRLLLPLGDLTKERVREIARKLGLPAADRPESQEICFIEDNDYCRFLEALVPDLRRPGQIIGPDGRTLGTHEGIYRYTLGQRKGLGVASSEPLFVTKIDRIRNAVHVGHRDDAMRRSIRVGEINWLCTPETSPFQADVKVRSMMEARPALLCPDSAHVDVVFDEPQWAPAPGQSAVFYRGDTVIGGGIILDAREECR